MPAPIRISPEQANAMAPAGGSACAPCQTGPRPATEPGPVLPAEERTDWIALILKDDRGQPVPNQDVELRLDSGATLRGRTDGEGKVRFEGVEPSRGIAHFAAIPDHRDWS